MVLLNLVLLVSLSLLPVATKAGELSQAEADARCQSSAKYGAGFVGKKNESGGWTCVRTTDVDEPCFENEYTDPKTGKEGCCVDNTAFSFDADSKEGKCCLAGSTFSWQAKTKKGECCAPIDGKETVYKCGCEPKEKKVDPQETPKCPEGSGKTWKVGGKNYKLFCNKMVGGANIKDCEPQASSSICPAKCAEVKGCKSVEWLQKKCCYKTNDKEPPYDIEGIENWLEVPDDTSRKTSNAPPWCPMGHGKTLTTGGKTFALNCELYIGYGGEDLGTVNVPDNAACAAKCADTPRCKGADYVGTSRNCYLKGSNHVTSNVGHDWVSWTEVDGPAGDEPSCPTDNGKTKEVAGKTYKLTCNMQIGTAEASPSQKASSAKECLEKCSAIPACKGVDFDIPTTVCAFKYYPLPTSSRSGMGTWALISAEG